MLIYITGAPGVGKSTVHRTLLGRGYESYDVDDGFAHTYNLQTGKPVSINKLLHTRAWHENNEWRMSLERVKQLAEQIKDRKAFLCGVARNDADVLGMFSHIVVLNVDEEILRKRLSSRKVRFGTAQEEQELAIEWRRAAQGRYREHGAQVIDASRPVNEVVDDILKLTK